MKIWTITEIDKGDTGYLREPADGIWQQGFYSREAAMEAIDRVVEDLKELDADMPWDYDQPQDSDWIGYKDGTSIREYGTIQFIVNPVTIN